MSVFRPRTFLAWRALTRKTSMPCPTSVSYSGTQWIPVDSIATVVMPMASNHRAIDFRSLVKLENFRTDSSSSSAGMAAIWNRLPMSLPAERGLTTLRRARRRRDGEGSVSDLLQLANGGSQSGSALKSEQFPDRDQHHGKLQHCRPQGMERCANPGHVSFRGRASKDVIGHGLTTLCPAWQRALVLAVGVSGAWACRGVLVRFLAEGGLGISRLEGLEALSHFV